MSFTGQEISNGCPQLILHFSLNRVTACSLLQSLLIILYIVVIITRCIIACSDELLLLSSIWYPIWWWSHPHSNCIFGAVLRINFDNNGASTLTKRLFLGSDFTSINQSQSMLLEKSDRNFWVTQLSPINVATSDDHCRFHDFLQRFWIFASTVVVYMENLAFSGAVGKNYSRAPFNVNLSLFGEFFWGEFKFILQIWDRRDVKLAVTVFSCV